jgi:hypothetical protein
VKNYTRNEWRTLQTTLQTSGEHYKLHSKRVEKITNYTRNEWRTLQTTLQTSGEDYKLHSKRVERTINLGSPVRMGSPAKSVRNALAQSPRSQGKTTLETSGKDEKYSQNECEL